MIIVTNLTMSNVELASERAGVQPKFLATLDPPRSAATPVGRAQRNGRVAPHCGLRAEFNSLGGPKKSGIG